MHGQRDLSFFVNKEEPSPKTTGGGANKTCCQKVSNVLSHSFSHR